MNFHFPNCSVTLDDLLAGKINQNLTDAENYILRYVEMWIDGYGQFEFQTSGSTGIPKKILLSRTQLSYSARVTLDHLYPVKTPKNLLLCINPKFIGGSQVLTRSLLSKSNLFIKEACANPLKNLKQFVDLASMVPLQVETILSEDPKLFDRVGTVLIGGAPLNPTMRHELSKLKTSFFETYGMTETASHIALRSVSQSNFYFLGDIAHKVDERGCLGINGTVTDHKWIQTNDVVEFTDNRFKILGRADWVINSGGIKIHPELIEQKIHQQFENASAYVTSVRDERLGEKLVLCCQKSLLEEIKKANTLSKYELPKQELIVKDFPLTPAGKIDRKQLRSYAQNNLR